MNDMGKVFLDMAVSLDGFVSGPNGADGGLHTWYFEPSEPSREVIDELLRTIGAMIVGRRAYGVGPDPEHAARDPYQMPHFVLSHHASEEIERRDPRVTFVTEGVEHALELARDAADDKDICVAGGADVAQQFLRAGLLDEIRVHLVPVLLGGGLRLFDHLGDGRIELEQTRVTEATGVTHLRYRVVKT
jgi:dihydrofolate reductase